MQPTPVAVGVAKNLGIQPPPPLSMTVKRNNRDHWSTVDEIAQATADLIATSAMGISETVEAVKQYGCTHVAEFNATVNKTNDDLKKFSDDYLNIRNKHANKSGPITSMEDRALSISVVEEYRQFQAMFNGVMGHSVIAFTEFALEVKDRLSASTTAPFN